MNGDIPKDYLTNLAETLLKFNRDDSKMLALSHTSVKCLWHFHASKFSYLFLFFPITGYTVIAFAMYYFTYDPWIGKLLYLEDFYVMQQYRGKTEDKFNVL